MEKKLVSVRLNEESLQNFKKIARQQGMTFTQFVDESMHYYSNFIIEKTQQDTIKNSSSKQSTALLESSNTVKYPNLVSNLESALQDKRLLDSEELPKQNHKVLKIITQLLKDEREKSIRFSNQIEEIKEQLNNTDN